MTSADLLDVWERGRDASLGERGLRLLELAEPGEPPDALASWSAGRRDAALLALRERLFGSRLAGLAACPTCDEPLELDVEVDDLVVTDGARVTAELTVERDGWRVLFRAPNAADLASLPAVEDTTDGVRWLLERCITAAEEDDAPRTAGDLPDAVIDAVTGAMAEHDPQADVELSLSCPGCGAGFRRRFDIVSFLWREIDAHASALVRDVAALASAFGWSERDVLAMSARRRGCYLELIGA